MDGWIKLHRSLLDSFVFSNPITLKIWIWILLKATKKKRVVSLKVGIGYQDIVLNPGELIFGRTIAEEQLKIDGSTIYRHLQKLDKSGNINIKPNSHYTLINICNWYTYQEFEHKTELITDSQQTTDGQYANNTRTTDEHIQESKECKECRESKKGEREKRALNFYSQIAEYKNIYPKELLRAFYEYWIEPNKSGTKMRFELEKTWDLKLRLKKWARNEKIPVKQPESKPIETERIFVIDPDTGEKNYL